MKRTRTALLATLIAISATTTAVATTTRADATIHTTARSKTVKVGKTPTNLRDCYHPTKQPYPAQNCTKIATIPAGTQMTLVCQYEGNLVEHDDWWDYVRTPNNGYGYMSDWYVNTGSSSYRVPGIPLCNY